MSHCARKPVRFKFTPETRVGDVLVALWAAGVVLNYIMLEIRGAFKKFCNSTIKKNGIVTNCTLFFNIIPTVFKVFATFFWQTVNSTKIEIF